MRNVKIAFALLVAAGVAFAQEAPLEELRPSNHPIYASPHRTFSCEIPKGWQAFEEETLQGSSAHFLGPAEADGAFRAAIHVHYIAKDRPGFVPLEAAIKQERRSDKDTSRDSSGIRFLRISRNQARQFDVVETRQLPRETLPSHPVALHHYYVFINSVGGYFIVKMSTTRATYLNYRSDFDHLLSTFQIIGY